MISEKNKLIGVLVLAAALRLAGVQYGLPEVYHQDEPIMVNHALAIGASGGNPHFFIIGSFGLYVLFAAFALYYAVGHLTGVFSGLQAFASAYLADPTAFYLLGRLILGAAFGTATVWAVHRTAKRWVSERAAFWSALFLAVLPVHVQHSHYIYADVPLAFASLLLLDALCGVSAKPGLRMYILAGLLAGWAVSIKLTAVYFLPAALAAHFLAFPGKILSGEAFSKFGSALAAALAAFFVLTPFALLSWSEFYSQVSAQTGAESPVGIAHHFVYSIIGGSGFLFAALSVSGFVTASHKHRHVWIILATAFVSYYAVNSFFGQPFARYMMPLVPLLAVLAGAGTASLLESKMFPRALGIFLVSAAFLEMAAVSAYSDLLFLKRDTRAQCREWIEKNVPAGSVIAVDSRFFGPRLKQTQEQIREKYQWLGDTPKDALRRKRLDLEMKSADGQASYKVYVLKLRERASDPPKFLFEGPYAPMDEEGLREIGAQYLILNHTDVEPAAHAMRIKMMARLEPVASFNPFREKHQLRPPDPHSSTAAPHLPEEIFRRERLGPALKVYKVSA